MKITLGVSYPVNYLRARGKLVVIDIEQQYLR